MTAAELKKKIEEIGKKITSKARDWSVFNVKTVLSKEEHIIEIQLLLYNLGHIKLKDVDGKINTNTKKAFSDLVAKKPESSKARWLGGKIDANLYNYIAGLYNDKKKAEEAVKKKAEEDKKKKEEEAQKKKMIVPDVDTYSFDDDKYIPYFDKYNNILMRKSNMDIDIVIGTQNQIKKKITHVFLRGCTIEVDATGNPIYMSYDFVGQDLKEEGVVNEKPNTGITVNDNSDKPTFDITELQDYSKTTPQQLAARVNALVKDATKEVIGLKTLEGAQILRKEMINTGYVQPNFTNNAHHIVPYEFDDYGMALLRQKMNGYGIDTNAAVNGVFLPDEGAFDQIRYGKMPISIIGQCHFHISYHPKEWYDHVYTTLNGTSSKAEFVAGLEKLRTELMTLSLPSGFCLIEQDKLDSLKNKYDIKRRF
jgi:hypothetical protein